MKKGMIEICPRDHLCKVWLTYSRHNLCSLAKLTWLNYWVVGRDIPASVWLNFAVFKGGLKAIAEEHLIIS